MGQEFFHAKEDTDCCTRNCCGPTRPFGMVIKDNNDQEVMYLDRPLRCQSCLYPCCLQSLDVQAPPGNTIGTVEQVWSLCSPRFDIRDQNGDVVLTIEGPWLTYSICGDVEFQVRKLDMLLLRFRSSDSFSTGIEFSFRSHIRVLATRPLFQVLSPDGSCEVGKISKQWTGLAREVFTDADNFGISFPMDLDVRMKAVLIGAMFLIDFMFFEKKGNEESDGIGML